MQPRPTHYVALKLRDPTLVENLKAMQRRLVLCVPALREALIPPEQLHMTLLLVCAVNASEVDAVEAALETIGGPLVSALLGWAPLELSSRLEWFSHKRRPSVVYARGREEAACHRGIHALHLGLCEGLPFVLKDKSFRPHVTLMKTSRLPEPPCEKSSRKLEQFLQDQRNDSLLRGEIKIQELALIALATSETRLVRARPVDAAAAAMAIQLSLRACLGTQPFAGKQSQSWLDSSGQKVAELPLEPRRRRRSVLTLALPARATSPAMEAFSLPRERDSHSDAPSLSPGIKSLPEAASHTPGRAFRPVAANPSSETVWTFFFDELMRLDRKRYCKELIGEEVSDDYVLAAIDGWRPAFNGPGGTVNMVAATSETEPTSCLGVCFRVSKSALGKFAAKRKLVDVNVRPRLLNANHPALGKVLCLLPMRVLSGSSCWTGIYTVDSDLPKPPKPIVAAVAAAAVYWGFDAKYVRYLTEIPCIYNLADRGRAYFHNLEDNASLRLLPAAAVLRNTCRSNKISLEPASQTAQAVLNMPEHYHPASKTRRGARAPRVQNGQW